ncbi:MAG TPA: tyrosine-type recombinase/integrase, partial [Lachnospiraceae bacterium]|nr:tyrosine-type recombinase/integrase [Lachnospiraceae bacterium]
SLENQPLFCSIHAPFHPLSRSAIWSIVSTTIASTVDPNGRKRGSHAIRSSMASGLIADDVPYPIVQKILGHTDPNATKRYYDKRLFMVSKLANHCIYAAIRQFFFP